MSTPALQAGRTTDGARKAADARPALRSGATAWPAAKVRLRTLNDLDRRTRAAQEVFQLRDDLAADLGGWDHLSAMQRELVENSAVLGAMLKDASAAYLSGTPIDLAEFMALTNAQRRLLADLGLERRARNATPDLTAYVNGRAS